MDNLLTPTPDPLPHHKVSGEIRLVGLPEHHGLLLSVRRHTGHAPNPVGARIEELAKDIHLESAREGADRTFPFEFEWGAGDYLFEVRAILLRKDWKDRLIAQSEPKVFVDRPMSLTEPLDGLLYEATWPPIPLEELENYGVIHSDGRTERLWFSDQ